MWNSRRHKGLPRLVLEAASSHRGRNSDDGARTRKPWQAAWDSQQEKFMRALISALAVAGAVAFALPAFADDVKTDPAKATAKPGRAIDDGAVKSGPVEKPGRAADDSAVKSGKDMTKPGRAADDTKAPAKKKKKKTQTPAN
jgi:hypothetical protein